MRSENVWFGPVALRRPWAAARARPWLTVSILGALSAAVWAAGLLLPYNIGQLGLPPLRDIAQLTRGNPAAQAGYVLTFAALSAIYYLAWRICRGQTAPALWRAVIAGAVAANAMLMWLYPVGAADVFDYIVRGRITAVRGGNPFYDSPSALGGDAYYPYSAWPGTTSAYGPLWELLAAGASRLAGASLLANLILFKLLTVLAYAGGVVLTARLLRRHAPERALAGVCLFAWNPLVLYETAGNGHNDMVMVLCVLVGLSALASRRYTWGALAFVAGALVKFIPALLVPIAVAAGLRAAADWRGRLAYLARTSFAAAALIGLTYAPFVRGAQWLQPLGFDRRAAMFTTSFPAFMQAQLEPRVGLVDSARLLSISAAGAMVLAALLTAWWVGRRAPADWLTPVRAVAVVFLCYLLGACLWFQGWYVVWLVPLAALLPEGPLARLIVLFSYSAVWKTIIFNYWLDPGPLLPPRVWRETWLGPATLGVTWLYGAYAGLRHWINWSSARPQPELEGPP